MNIEPKQPTRKGPTGWFAGDVYIDAIHVRQPEPSRMSCGRVHFAPGARTAWHVTDEQYKAAAAAAEAS